MIDPFRDIRITEETDLSAKAFNRTQLEHARKKEVLLFNYKGPSDPEYIESLCDAIKWEFKNEHWEKTIKSLQLYFAFTRNYSSPFDREMVYMLGFSFLMKQDYKEARELLDEIYRGTGTPRTREELYYHGLAASALAEIAQREGKREAIVMRRDSGLFYLNNYGKILLTADEFLLHAEQMKNSHPKIHFMILFECERIYSRFGYPSLTCEISLLCRLLLLSARQGHRPMRDYYKNKIEKIIKARRISETRLAFRAEQFLSESDFLLETYNPDKVDDPDPKIDYTPYYEATLNLKR